MNLFRKKVEKFSFLCFEGIKKQRSKTNNFINFYTRQGYICKPDDKSLFTDPNEFGI